VLKIFLNPSNAIPNKLLIMSHMECVYCLEASKGCFYSDIKRFMFIEGLKKKKEKHSILLFKYLGLLLIFEVACQLLSFNDYKEIKETERERENVSSLFGNYS
jgi:hypothetical protein